MQLNYNGLLIGFLSFLIIGIFHPIVIKVEYYYGKKMWPLFMVVGIVCIVASFVLDNNIASIILGVFGFSSLWSIHELIEQEQRVLRGWFPSNPNKK